MSRRAGPRGPASPLLKVSHAIPRDWSQRPLGRSPGAQEEGERGRITGASVASFASSPKAERSPAQARDPRSTPKSARFRTARAAHVVHAPSAVLHAPFSLVLPMVCTVPSKFTVSAPNRDRTAPLFFSQFSACTAAEARALHPAPRAVRFPPRAPRFPRCAVHLPSRAPWFAPRTVRRKLVQRTSLMGAPWFVPWRSARSRSRAWMVHNREGGGRLTPAAPFSAVGSSPYERAKKSTRPS